MIIDNAISVQRLESCIWDGNCYKLDRLVIKWNTLLLGENLHLLSGECPHYGMGQFSFYPVGHWFSAFPPQSAL